MCWLITDAKSLPPGVYVCDKTLEEEEPSVEKNHHHDHSEKENHGKHGKDKCHGPPWYVWIYPIALIVSMVANRCFLCKFACTLKRLETPVVAV